MTAGHPALTGGPGDSDDPPMDTERNFVLRDTLALVTVAVACPLAVLAQWFIGCVGQGVDARCATNAVVISPLLLVLAGVLAGWATSGWTGLLLSYVGGVIGMTSILALAWVIGREVPFDPISGVIATFWFMMPVTIGYGLARIGARVFATRNTGG